jgi:Mrp family chromosome partitioning ATPase
MSSLDQAFIKAYLHQGVAAASPASAPRAMPLADALVEHERERSRGRAKASLDGVLAALQRQPKSPVEPPPKPAPPLPEPEIEPDAIGAEWFLPPMLRKKAAPEPEPELPEPNDPSKPIATLADFGVTAKVYRVDQPAAPVEAAAAETQAVPPPHLGGEGGDGGESLEGAAVAAESAVAAAIEADFDDNASDSESASFTAATAAPAPAPPFRPLLQVDRFVWPPVCNRLVSAASEQIDRFCETFVAANARGQKVLAIAGYRAGEGATTLLFCVARRLADRGLRIAIIDADPDAPQLARQFGLQIECGWETVLLGHLPLAEVVIESSDRQVALLPLCSPRGVGGKFPDNPSVAAECIDTLAAQYDLVLVDLGPLEQTAGGKAIPCGIGDHLDAAVLVQDMRKTSTERLVEVQRNLRSAGIAHAGVVRNLVQP